MGVFIITGVVWIDVVLILFCIYLTPIILNKLAVVEYSKDSKGNIVYPYELPLPPNVEDKDNP